MKKLLALIVCLPLMSATCNMPPVITNVLQCGEDAVVQKIPALTTGILNILRTGGSDWQVQLTAYLAAVIPVAAECAWAVVYAELVGGTGAKATPGCPSLPTGIGCDDTQAAARARQYQAMLKIKSAKK
jgi:hypothetical protein